MTDTADRAQPSCPDQQVTSPRDFAQRLVANLKALNAKERDHLMRLAYLGAEECYEDSRRWLSEPMTAKLRQYAAPGANCVFAAMDYHLDWIYAALLGACSRSAFEALGQPLAIDQDCKDASLQAVIGIQEDVDLIAVFVDGAAPG